MLGLWVELWEEGRGQTVRQAIAAMPPSLVKAQVCVTVTGAAFRPLPEPSNCSRVKSSCCPRRDADS